jgi:thiamine-monophosphate kinase
MARRAPSGESGEDRLIARYFKPIARHPGAFDLIDDAAALAPLQGNELVLTVDAIVAGVHFFADDPAETVAMKALRVNLSDLAAKGAKPVGFLLTLALPKGVSDRWLAGFSRGLAADAKRYGCPVLGGDTVHTPGPMMISVTAFGTLPKGQMVHRFGARPGDHVVVTGTIGDAVLGLKLRTGEGARWQLGSVERKHLASRYRVPQPRNAIAAAVRAYATAAMDVSDGLAGDLAKLCRASKVGAQIDVARVPLSKSARRALASAGNLIEPMLSGGDDYEVLCTVPSRRLAAFEAAARKACVPVTAIGRIVKGEGARFLRSDGKALRFKRASFSHF